MAAFSIPRISCLYVPGILFFSIILAHGQTPFIENGKMGFHSAHDSVLVPPVYDFVQPFLVGYNWTTVANGRYFESGDSGEQPAIQFSGEFGLLHKNGKEILPPRYSIILHLYRHHAVAGIGTGFLQFEDWPTRYSINFSGEVGLIDFTGEEVLPLRMKEIIVLDEESEGIWLVSEEPLPGYFIYNSEGIRINEWTVDTAWVFQDGFSRVMKNNRYGYIDPAGRLCIDFLYEDAEDFYNGSALVRKGSEIFYIDSGGTPRKDKAWDFEEMDPSYEGLLRVRLFNKYGFLKENHTFLAYPQYTNATPFFNGISCVEKKDSIGYLYADGRCDLVKKYTVEPEPALSLPDWFWETLPDSSALLDPLIEKTLFFDKIPQWDFFSWVTYLVRVFQWAPYLYINFPELLPKVCSGEGLFTGRYEVAGDFIKPGNPAWEKFKHYTLVPLLSDEKLRQKGWDSVRPILKKAFQSMPALHQTIYLDILDYLRNYYAMYPYDQVKHFLEEHPEEFAKRHWDGSTSDYRKASAQVDRFIFIYGILTPGEARKWTSDIYNECQKWIQ